MLQLDQHTLIRKHHSSCVYLWKHQTAASVSFRTAEDRWQESPKTKNKRRDVWSRTDEQQHSKTSLMRRRREQHPHICFRIIDCKSSYHRNTADETDEMTGRSCKKREIIFCINKMKSVEAGGPRLTIYIYIVN